MKRRRVLWVAGACAVALVLALLWPRQHEPEYEGKRLSEWVRIAEENQDWDPSAELPLGRHARQAVRLIGTNALPYLLSTMPRKHSKVSAIIDSALVKIPNEKLRHQLLAPQERERDWVAAFKILGPLASPAIPELTRRVRESEDSTTRVPALSALGHIGFPAYSVLRELVRNPKDNLGLYAGHLILSLDRLDFDISEALPDVLMQAHAHAGGYVPLVVAIGRQSITVPKIATCLAHTNAAVRAGAAEVFAHLDVTSGLDVQRALPALVERLEDSDASVRASVTNALQKFAPEILQGRTRPEQKHEALRH